MSSAKYPTFIHERVDRARNGADPKVICRIPSGWVVLGDDQRLRGYSLLLADPVVPNLNALDAHARGQFLMDMSIIGDVLLEVVQAALINYSILGNLERALHGHVHPRFDSEPDEMRRDHWLRYSWKNEPAVDFDLERDRPLMESIRTALASRTDVLA